MRWHQSRGMDEAQGHADWRRWLEEQAPKFLLFARQQTRSETDAQDLVQEATIEAVNRCGNNRPPPAALVFATIRRRAVDLARSDHRRANRELAVFGNESDVWFDTSIEDREQARLVQEAMSRLPEIYRSVLTLKLWGELTFAEIADTLSIPANTAASRYRYALEQMRKLMKEVHT